MKNFVKLAAAFTLGIIVTIAVIFPKLHTKPEPIEPPQTTDIQAEIRQAVDAAVREALAEVKEPTPIQAELPAEQKQDIEPTEVKQTLETAEPEESEQAEVTVKEPEPTKTPEPVKEEPKVQPTSSPQVTATPTPQVKKAEPEYFYEDGKKYTYINGFKCLITDEPDVQLDYYDWENDPNKDIKGPFN